MDDSDAYDPDSSWDDDDRAPPPGEYPGLDLDSEPEPEPEPEEAEFSHASSFLTMHSARPTATAHACPQPLIRFIDILALSTKWFGPESVGSFGAGWWRAAQTRFLDHVDFVPGPIWATADRSWLWLAWARTYPLPIMSSRVDTDPEEPGPSDPEFGMWRPPGPQSGLTEWGRKNWNGADLDAYCTLWTHMWHRMRTSGPDT